MRPLTAQGSYYISYKRNRGYCLVLFLPLKTQLALFLAATSISCLTARTRRFCTSVMPSIPSKSVRLKRDAGKDIKGMMRSLPWNYESLLLAGTVPGLCCVSCQEGGDFVMVNPIQCSLSFTGEPQPSGKTNATGQQPSPNCFQDVRTAVVLRVLPATVHL